MHRLISDRRLVTGKERSWKGSPLAHWEIKGKCWFRPVQLSNNFLNRMCNIHNFISLLHIAVTSLSYQRKKIPGYIQLLSWEILKNHQFHRSTSSTLLVWYLLFFPKPSQWYSGRRSQWVCDSTLFTTWHGFCTSCWKPIKCEHRLQSRISTNVWSTQIPKEYGFTAGLFVLLHKALERLFNMRVTSFHIMAANREQHTA